MTIIHTSPAWPKQKYPVQLSPEALQAAQKQLGTSFKTPTVAKKKKKKKNYNSEGWVQVNNMLVACGDLLRSSLTLTPLLNVRELLLHVKQPKLLVRNISAITRDTTALAKELQSIRKYIEDCRQKCRNEGESMNAAQTAFTHCVNFMERYDSALFPLIEHASEQLQEALVLFEAVEPEKAIQLRNNMLLVISKISSIVRDTIGATEA